MKLSVLIITYNHEKYIAQALDSVLMQEAAFDYEIVIGEDCSTDATRNIVCDYQKRHPEKIRLLLSEKNLGMMRNFVETYNACKGEYIAVLEGDDYWTDSLKLQKQVDFLESHPDFVICFHNAQYLWERIERAPGLLCRADQKAISTIEDLLYDNFIPTLTVMFRNKLFGSFPDWIFGLKYGDWPLHILNAQFGKIGYLNESMAVYRVHSGGAASGAHTDKRKYLDNIKGIIDVYEKVNIYFEYRYNAIIKKRLPEYYYIVAMTYEVLDEKRSALKYYLKFGLSLSLLDIVKRAIVRLKRSVKQDLHAQGSNNEPKK